MTISDAIPSPTIYYTTNGAAPTTSSTLYSGPVTVSTSETLEAIASASGYSPGPAGTAIYTIGRFNGPIATIQHNSGTTESSTSLQVAFKNPVTSGNLLLVAESSADGVSLVTPTDTQNNSFTQLVTAGASGDSVAAIYSASASSSAADTVTCGVSASNNIHCHIYEVQGVEPTVDQIGSSLGPARR